MAMHKRTALAVTLTALALPAAASAGGWATVSVDPTPGPIRAGQPWDLELTVLQHGRTPLRGVRPRVAVRRPGREAVRSFAARPTRRPGVYAARVEFPRSGVWSYEVDDGFRGRHAIGEVRVSAAATRPAEAERASSWPVLLAALPAAGLGLVWLAIRRRRGSRPPTPG